MQINRLFTFQCPCCQQYINAIKIVHPQVNNGCKSKVNYKCFYCPKCDSKIGKARSARFDIFVQIFVILFIYFFVNTISDYFVFEAYINFILYLISFYFILVVFVKLYKFKCFKEDKGIERKNSMTDQHPYDNVRIDDVEQKMVKSIYALPMLFVATLSLVVLYLIFKN